MKDTQQPTPSTPSFTWKGPKWCEEQLGTKAGCEKPGLFHSTFILFDLLWGTIGMG